MISTEFTESRRRWPAVCVVACLLAVSCGETPEEAFDEFLEKTEDQRPEAGDGNDGMLAEIDGQYLMVLESTVDPAHPLQFLVDASIEIAEDQLSGSLTLVFQPLSLDPQCVIGPREPVGDPIPFEPIPVGPNGDFVLDMGLQMVSGAANPITGSDITATLVLEGSIQDEDLWCGTVIEGAVMSPIQAPLENSTFSATRVTGVDALPELFPTKCPGPDGDGTREEVPEC